MKASKIRGKKVDAGCSVFIKEYSQSPYALFLFENNDTRGFEATYEFELTGYQFAEEDAEDEAIVVELQPGESCVKRLVETKKAKKAGGGFNPMAGLLDDYE